ncbi:hypothetical protein AAHD79_16800 [Citrobacter freundii]|uniref:hypothetical protein n=1 Tax=Citrobacter freundii TaxID=546 RepID=UPI0039672B38
MTALNKQALREAAQEEIMLRSVSDTSDYWQDEASPEAVLALLAELEAAEKCIAELDTRTVTIKLPADYRNDDGSINDDMFNTCEVVGAFREALAAAGIGVKGE